MVTVYLFTSAPEIAASPWHQSLVALFENRYQKILQFLFIGVFELDAWLLIDAPLPHGHTS